ncbi:conserved hypothetical protein [Ricinus communis]|uniref:Uncharacterized protein n=1 Tax=Ricinus communis TaxID=3988 RepID=B9TAU4_RICCO|nr:conserved hypothetical protein [Ricinus communis]
MAVRPLRLTHRRCHVCGGLVLVYRAHQHGLVIRLTAADPLPVRRRRRMLLPCQLGHRRGSLSATRACTRQILSDLHGLSGQCGRLRNGGADGGLSRLARHLPHSCLRGHDRGRDPVAGAEKRYGRTTGKKRRASKESTARAGQESHRLAPHRHLVLYQHRLYRDDLLDAFLSVEGVSDRSAAYRHRIGDPLSAGVSGHQCSGLAAGQARQGA